MNSAFLLIGSNIDPEKNTRKAMQLLHSMVEITAVSRTWEIPSIGSPGPNFINFAVGIRTLLDAAEIKQQVIGKIETDLNRIRSKDKNAPRTIDIDIIVFNDNLLDIEIWNRPYVALPISDLLPELKRPRDSIKLREVAYFIKTKAKALIREDISFT
jgi:2-amino-4-hydroxy-6-hydroxymethyldihydropteridine diphosphokinase